jgi:hypothetical protein
MEKGNNIQKSNNRAWSWLLFSCLALIGGAIGGHFINSFFSQSSPYADLEIGSDLSSRTRPVIKEAKKVIVEQNDQVRNLSDELKSSILIIKRKAAETKTPWQEKYQYTKSYEAEALPLTSDGWLISPFALPEGSNIKDFWLIDQSGNHYQLEKIINDRFTGLFFYKIDNRNLSIKKISQNQATQNGSLVLATNWNGEAGLFTQTNNFFGDNAPIKSSDNLNEELKLDPLATKSYFTFMNMAGELTAFRNNQGKIISARTIKKDFDSLLKYGRVNRPSLGFNYINLNEMLPITGKKEKGFIVYADKEKPWPEKGPAIKAGLKNGDKLLAIKGSAPENYDQFDFFWQTSPGEDLEIKIDRQGKELTIKIKAGDNY